MSKISNITPKTNIPSVDKDVASNYKLINNKDNYLRVKMRSSQSFEIKSGFPGYTEKEGGLSIVSHEKHQSIDLGALSEKEIEIPFMFYYGNTHDISKADPQTLALCYFLYHS